MTNTAPFISVVTAVYNGAAYLPALIESVQAQTFSDYEHVIIDDGSTDHGATTAVIERYAKVDPRIRWWSRENKGAYPTQQEGLEATRGQFVIIINADDAFASPDAFSAFKAYADANPERNVIYGRTGRLDAEGNRLPQLDPHWRPSRWLIRQVCYVQHCSLFVSRVLIQEHDLWLNLDYRYVADWDWIIRLFQAGQIGYLPADIGCFRVHMGQRARQSVDAMQAESRAVCRRYGSSPRVYALIRQLLIYRSMTLIALDTLRKRGIRVFFARLADWLRRRAPNIKRREF